MTEHFDLGHGQSFDLHDVDSPISTREGWDEYVDRRRARLDKPDEKPMTARELRSLSTRDQKAYRQHRANVHAEMNVVAPQVQRILRDFEIVLLANQHEPGQVRPMLLLDAFAGLGKTRIAKAFGADFHEDRIEFFGRRTSKGHDHIPVAYISLTSKTTEKTLNLALAQFYGVAGIGGRNRSSFDLGKLVSECVHQCGTRLIIVDDIHFLNRVRTSNEEASDHLKYLSSDLTATFLLVGINVNRAGLLGDDETGSGSHGAQLGRRTSVYKVHPFSLKGRANRNEWTRVLNAIEKRTLLAKMPPGRLAVDLSEYLFSRSTGHFQSLMSLLLRGFAAAMVDGTETVTEESLEKIRIDSKAEKNRQIIEEAIARGDFDDAK